MKKLFFALIMLLGFTLSHAQSNTEEIDIMQSAFGREKKAVINEFVKLEDSQKDAFWTIYDEYETARKGLGKERIRLLNNYADQWENMTDEQADKWMSEVLALSSKSNKLLIKYFKKIKKVTSPTTATQFYQVESYILTVVRIQIMESIPFIDEK